MSQLCANSTQRPFRGQLPMCEPTPPSQSSELHEQRVATGGAVATVAFRHASSETFSSAAFRLPLLHTHIDALQPDEPRRGPTVERVDASSEHPCADRVTQRRTYRVFSAMNGARPPTWALEFSNTPTERQRRAHINMPARPPVVDHALDRNRRTDPAVVRRGKRRAHDGNRGQHETVRAVARPLRAQEHGGSQRSGRVHAEDAGAHSICVRRLVGTVLDAVEGASSVHVRCDGCVCNSPLVWRRRASAGCHRRRPRRWCHHPHHRRVHTRISFRCPDRIMHL